MDKSYKTSVRRAANKLAGLGASHEYTASYEAADQLLEDIKEVTQWLVDRDARNLARIKNFVKERIRNVAV